jgi:hypothetical protein
MGLLAGHRVSCEQDPMIEPKGRHKRLLFKAKLEFKKLMARINAASAKTQPAASQGRQRSPA